jgi:ribonucleoside-diphosphate reductase alpha chain
MSSLKLSQNAHRVLEARYLRRDGQRRLIETPEQLFARVAKAIAYAELVLGNARQAAHWEEAFLRILTALDFLPNSPTLMNAGTGLGQLSACFVLPVDDTMEGIFDAIKYMALVQRTGGGTGFSFSRLRPKGDVVTSTGGEASGPVSFMRIFDCATEHIKQGGKRRGANMGVLRVDHPDIMAFITAKRDETSLQNFNLSVSVTDAFLEAVRHDRSYALLDPRTATTLSHMPARMVFEAIADAAWRTGDPGLLFLDRINRANSTPHLGRIEATNPCGEIPLLPYESCTLGSINLAHMVDERGGDPAIDWRKLRTTVRTAVRFLDDVIEVNKYPLPEIERITRGTRKIGLGAMGFAEMLIRLGLSYDSDAAVDLARELAGVIAEEARQTSQQLAEERGVFPNWPGSVYEAQHLNIRNATCLAIAPTGTLSIIADTSASIEPLFALAYRRAHVLEGQTLVDINPILRGALQRYDLNAEGVMADVRDQGRLQDLPGLPEALQRVFVTALEIPAERHLQMQAAFQQHVDNAVSKTINLPPEATLQDVSQAYWRAWELGLKGITIYRYGSKATQVVELGVHEAAHYYDHAATCDPEECRV